MECILETDGMEGERMKEKIIQIIMVLVFISGLLVFLYPKYTEWKSAYETEKTIEEFEETLLVFQKAPDEKKEEVESVENNQDIEKKDNIHVEALYEDMVEYNKRLYREGQSRLKDPFSYENPSFNLQEYGFENNVIGTIEIEKIEVKLPLYLGATTANMKKGGVILGETSMPIGGENSNVVIAAHRGYQGIPMFREIEKIETGDKIEITTVFDTLMYQVTECKVILPNQINEILIQQGEDMITLLTCHPYTENTHRYLVFAKRCEEAEEENIVIENVSKGQEESVSPEITNLPEKNNEDKKTNGEKQETVSESHIRLETYVPIIGSGIIILMIVAGFILTRKRK